MDKPSIESFIEFCNLYPEETVRYMPVDVCSWRGSYNEPCIIVEESEDIPLKDYIQYCHELVGPMFIGYKGGEYIYGYNHELNFEFGCSEYSGSLSRFVDILASNDNNLVKKWIEFE